MDECTKRRRSGRDAYPCAKFPGGACPRRAPGYQDKCPDMIKAQAENRARKENERKQRDARRAVDEYYIASACRSNRKKRPER